MDKRVARVVAVALLAGGAALAPPNTGAQSDAPRDAARTRGGEVFDKASATVVKIATPGGYGSGVIVDASGLVASTLHVVDEAPSATVILANGDAYDDVTVVDYDERKDLVLLRIKGFKLAAAEFGDSDALRVGDHVFAIGTPQNLPLTLSDGIVSSLRDFGDGFRVVQTTAPTSAGSSGGGLFDDAGRLIALTRSKRAGGENLNFAVPINYLRGMMESHGEVTLVELSERLRRARAAAAEAARATIIPKLATGYVAPSGEIAIIEQNGGDVRISFSNARGVIFSSADMAWQPAKRAFAGPGTVKSRCGAVDARRTDATVHQEIYIVNDKTIRHRWTNPERVNCSKGTIERYTWQERIWYAR
jgi:hypothetical protein